MSGTVDAGAHSAQIPKDQGFVQGLSNPTLSVHEERDVRPLVDGDDFMVEVPTHEEKWFESVLFSQNDGKCTEKFHLDGSTTMETSFLSRVVRWDPTSGRAELVADPRHEATVLRDLGLSHVQLQLLWPSARSRKNFHCWQGRNL